MAPREKTFDTENGSIGENSTAPVTNVTVMYADEDNYATDIAVTDVGATDIGVADIGATSLTDRLVDDVVSESEPVLTEGSVLKNYTILGLLDPSGGFGDIYKARHNTLNIDVVLKRVNIDTQKQMGMDQYLDKDAKIMVKIRHERLPRVYDFIKTAHSVYTVMDYIDGQNLGTFVESGEPYTQEDIIRWGVQMCEAVNHLHTRENAIIHRDIKPGNVMLTKNRDIVLIDFNIASTVGDGEQVIAAASHGYAPPEQYPTQAKGQFVFKKFDERSDIYSIGATLYFLLTKKKPTKATDRNRITKISESDLFPWQSKSDPLSGLQAIIAKATLTEPKFRFQTAEEMRQALLNIRVFEGDYKKLAFLREVLTVTFTAVLVVGICLMIVGFRGRQLEVETVFGEKMAAAVTANNSGKYEDALELVQEAADWIPGRSETLLQRIRAYNGLGSYWDSDGLSVKTKNSDDNVLVSEIWYEKGIAAFVLERYQLAVQYYEKAYEYNNSDGMILRELIRSYAYNGDIEKARSMIDAFDTRLEIRSGVLAAEIYILQLDYNEAQTRLQQIIDMPTSNISDEEQTDYWRAVSLFANLHMNGQYLKGDQQEKLRNGITILESVKPYTQDKVYYHAELNEFLCRLYTDYAETDSTNIPFYNENMQYALNAMIENKSLNVAQIKTYLNMIALYKNLSQFDKAKETALEATAYFPDDYRPFMYLALLQIDIEYQKDRPDDRVFTDIYLWADKAEELYGKTLVRNPDQYIELLHTNVQRIKTGSYISGGISN